MENKYKGWIEGFGQVVTDQLGKDIKEKVFGQCESCQTVSSDKEMALCVKEVMNKFDQAVPEDEKRYNVIDVDPYGSPTRFLDSAVRALKNGGLIALTATDMAVLCGVKALVCTRKYFGKPLRT